MGEVAPTHAGPFHTSRFELRSCPECEVVYLVPLPTAADLATLYERSNQFSGDHYTTPERVREILDYYGHCMDEQGLLPPSGGACLEVGAGLAWVSRACKAREPGIRTVAQDLSSECARACAWVDRYVVGPIDAVTDEPPFHLISLTHVIEHLVDPGAMLAKLAPLLVPGGRMFITGPFRPQGWQSRDGLEPWKSYSYLHVPAHVSYLSRKWFQQQARALALELERWEDQHDGGQAFEVVLTRRA